MRILGEHNRGNLIYIYQIKKIPNFWEFEKNLVPPMPFQNSEKRVGDDVGERVGNGLKDVWGIVGEIMWGRIFGKVHVDKFGWGRKF